MIIVIRALMTAGVWINYRFMRAVFGLPLRLFPNQNVLETRSPVRYQPAFGSPLFGLFFLAAASLGWAYLILGPLSVCMFVAVIRMEERRALVRQ